MQQDSPQSGPAWRCSPDSSWSRLSYFEITDFMLLFLWLWFGNSRRALLHCCKFDEFGLSSLTSPCDADSDAVVAERWFEPSQKKEQLPSPSIITSLHHCIITPTELPIPLCRLAKYWTFEHFTPLHLFDKYIFFPLSLYRWNLHYKHLINISNSMQGSMQG